MSGYHKGYFEQKGLLRSSPQRRMPSANCNMKYREKGSQTQSGGRELSIYDSMCWVINLFLKLGYLASQGH